MRRASLSTSPCPGDFFDGHGLEAAVTDAGRSRVIVTSRMRGPSIGSESFPAVYQARPARLIRSRQAVVFGVVLDHVGPFPAAHDPQRSFRGRAAVHLHHEGGVEDHGVASGWRDLSHWRPRYRSI